jgi:hypothetical protein
MTIRKTTVSAAALLAAVLALSACATGPKLSETPEAQTSVEAGMSRIVVYRTGIFGTAIQPEITVDGEPTGKCQPNGAFHVDVNPGDHRLTATTEATSAVKLKTSENETIFVECSIGMGFFVGRPHLSVVDKQAGADAVRELVFIGQYRL